MKLRVTDTDTDEDTYRYFSLITFNMAEMQRDQCNR